MNQEMIADADLLAMAREIMRRYRPGHLLVHQSIQEVERELRVQGSNPHDTNHPEDFRVSLDGRVFSITHEKTADVDPEDLQTGYPVIITDEETKRYRLSFYEYPCPQNAGDTMLNFGFCDDLNSLYQLVTGHTPKDGKYKNV